MKVILLTGEPFPNGMAATNRIKCYARAIQEGGLDCEVLIFKRTEVYGKPIINTIGQGLYMNTPFRYISGKTLRNRNPFYRKVVDKIDLLRTLIYLYNNLSKGDVLFLFMSKPLDIMLYSMKIAHNKGAYCVRDLCELPYGTGAETEQAIRLRKALLEKQFPKLDGILSISDSLFNLAKVFSSDACKHIKVPIMVEYDHYAIDFKKIDHNAEFIFHAGTLYQQKDGILGMIEAFGIAKQQISKPIKYVLTGDINTSSHPKELRNLIKKFGLEGSIEFVGYLNQENIKKYLGSASLVISNRPRTKQDYYGFSTKLGEYLASGTPLITTSWGEAVNWLTSGESAFIVEPEDTKALADAIVYCFKNPNEAHNVGLKGQEVCRRYFNFQNWSYPIVSFLQKLGE